ncbi:MAG: DUF3090 family protein, partial [Anaerolineales bacterium]|nr:DUF3090 family protein [Anaerolineales bacterium]
MAHYSHRPNHQKKIRQKQTRRRKRRSEKITMARQLELNPVTHLTIGTVGQPGNRTFYLQGSRGSQSISLIIEKQQAAMLAESFESFLEE